ncbi:hypothetical protein [Paraflavitalea sp. CAU 1676]|uniref:hypothetical protein n=1 Tax=Paraflavitalea sp. CAU 1676 TaxID=3032598 RepID=UPI0023DAE987|nr:hypothetical protein [Paraflavitalea sp. CAU 1676]MDF2189934.1 hypothetical protein [Paraflavitalea sp. CAU 1676]
MKKSKSASPGRGQTTAPKVPVNKRSGSADLPDTPEDEAKMKEEETTLDLPDVKDIPGQEHIHVPRMSEYADTTISSEDEEGDSILDDREDEDFRADRGTTNVTKEEADRLRDAAGYTTDEEGRRIRATALDSTDDDGDPLNEKGFSNAYSGRDLDVPGSEDDDADEAIGEEDEENNAYSLDEENEDDEK